MPVPELTIENIEDSVVIKLYEQLNRLFGQGSQVFSMEYPPRSLNARDYAYTIEDHTGVLFKPQTVAEAEFNLSDNIIDLAPIVQGSTGERVSNLYKSVLNNYIPRLHYAARLAEEKGKLKGWLLKPIKGTVLDYDEASDTFVQTDFDGTRMEYSARLYRTYLYKRQAFNEQVNEKKKDARQADNSRDAGVDFADWLSTVAATKEEILSTFYNDAVVRGNLHEVNSAISFLDIPSLGQRLNEIKRDLRSNVKRSVIGGGDVYTVNFSPSNWFESLTMSPSPIDVVTNASYRENLILSKGNELNNARQQLSSLQNLSISEEKQASLEQEIKSLNKEIDSAYIEVRKLFQERLVTAVQFAQEALSKTAEFAMAAYTGGTSAAFTSQVSKLAQKKARTTDTQEISHIEKISEQTKGALETFVKLDRARQESVELKSKLAMAKSSDYTAQIKMLQHQINQLTEELKVLESEDALYPSSLEQLKSDVYYAAQERSAGEDGTNDEILKEIKSLRELDQNREAAIDTSSTGYKDLLTKKIKSEQDKWLAQAKSDISDLGTCLINSTSFEYPIDNDASANIEKNKDSESAWKKYINDDINTKSNKTSNQKISEDSINKAYIEIEKTIKNIGQGDLKQELKKIKVEVSVLEEVNFTSIAKDSNLNKDQIEKSLNSIIKDGVNQEEINKAGNVKNSLEESRKGIEQRAQNQLESDMMAKKEHEMTSKVISLAKRLGVGKPSEEKDDYYQTIIVEIDCENSSHIMRQGSQASSGGKSHDYWFSSGSSSYNQSSASTSSTVKNKQMKITLKLRATKVNIERGGWFGVDILRLTEGMFHVDPNLKSATGDEYSNFLKHGKVVSTGKFTHYPTSFLIVKDVEIIKSSSEAFKTDKQSSSSSNSSSRRDHWFSSKHNESSQQSRHEEGEGDSKRYFETISLPNPMIIGWFQQVVPKDESLEYAKTQEKKEEFSETINQFLKSIVYN